MEFLLSTLWAQAATSARGSGADIPELRPVAAAVNALRAEMVHFVGQIQYYFVFEVLECAWAALQAALAAAVDLDQVSAAHTSFLSSVAAGVFLAQGSTVWPCPAVSPARMCPCSSLI